MKILVAFFLFKLSGLKWEIGGEENSSQVEAEPSQLKGGDKGSGRACIDIYT